MLSFWHLGQGEPCRYAWHCEHFLANLDWMRPHSLHFLVPTVLLRMSLGVLGARVGVAELLSALCVKCSFSRLDFYWLAQSVNKPTNK